MRNSLIKSALAGIFVVASLGAAEAGDAALGKKVFNKCKSCHEIKEGGKKKKQGPNLYGIVGRAAAGEPNFKKYSDAMKASGLVWDEENLRAFLKKPKGFMKKTKMNFAGVKKDADMDNLMAYLKANGK